MADAVNVPSLKGILDRLYADFNSPDSATDPIQIVRRYERQDDREVVGFLAAALAFGRVASVLQSIERLLSIVGDRPAAYVRRFEPNRDGAAFAGLGHRWTRGPDLVALVWLISQMAGRSGSIEGFFSMGDPEAPDIEGALDRFSIRALALDMKAAYGRVPRRPGVCYFFPRPSAGSACKRLNLFLRWMVRRDALDLGVWTRVSPAKLSVPLDTHVIRVGRCLGLTALAIEPRMADGPRHYRVAPAPGSGRPGQVRLRALPPRDDERLRLQPDAGGYRLSATWRVPATRSYTSAVPATIRSTVKRERTRARPASPIWRLNGWSLSSFTIATARAA